MVKRCLSKMYQLQPNSENGHFVTHPYQPHIVDNPNEVVIFDTQYGAHLPYQHTIKNGEREGREPSYHYNMLRDNDGHHQHVVYQSTHKCAHKKALKKGWLARIKDLL